MKIAYDGSSLLIRPFTGVGNYVQHLLAALLREGKENSYWLLSHRPTELDPKNGSTGTAEARWAQAFFPNRLVWMQCVLPFVLRTIRPEVVHFPNFVAPLVGGDNVVVTVHDLALFLFPEFFTTRQRLVMRPFIAPAVRHAQAIITVSERSKADIVRILGAPPARVHVIYEAAAPGFFQPCGRKEALARLAGYGWDAGAQNVLYVGSVEPRKNLERLVSALALLKRRGKRAHLWVVGQGGHPSPGLARRSEELGLRDNVHFTGYVPVPDLRAFYACCDAFVLPSLYEGFGLPVIEAMASGAPVAISDSSALREIAGEAALYFDPRNPDAIAAALDQVLARNGLQASLREASRQRAAQFSWERAARETLAVYARVAERREV